MIIGVGVDIVKIPRLEKMLASDFQLCRLFTDRELEYIHSRGVGAINSLAANYAAKEAFFKALGTGLILGDMKSVELLHAQNGKPYLNFSGAIALKMQGARAHISLSHDGDYAIAYVQLEEAMEAGK